MTTRKPCVAGQFYPSSQSELTTFIDSYANSQVEQRDACAVIMPHAGYIYSGKTAARTIAHVNVTDTVLMLGPNHTGMGTPFSLMAKGSWITPLGEVNIDSTLAQKIIDSCPLIKDDASAHFREHSLEVQVPFLQHRKNNVKIVPLTVGTHAIEEMKVVAQAIAQVLSDEKALILVSSDMTHYESKSSAAGKDKRAIEAIKKLDEDLLAKVVSEYDISMCGFVPTYIALIIAKKLGAEKGELVEYTTSGEVTGDDDQVVGYAGMIIS